MGLNIIIKMFISFYSGKERRIASVGGYKITKYKYKIYLAQIQICAAYWTKL